MISAQTRLHRFGTGARQALALHCSLAHGGVWAGLAAQLPGLTLHAPDLPGHGGSADWDKTGDYHDHATDVSLSVLTDIAKDGPIDLIGHSFGGTVALRLALAAPHLVRSLTLFEPVLFCAARHSPDYTAFLQAQAPYGAAVSAKDWPLAARLFNRIWGNGDTWDTLPKTLQSYLTDRMHLVTACDAVLFDDAAGLLHPGRLETLHMPILLAEGGQSPAIIGAIMQALAARLPQAQRHIEPGAGHMLPLTHAASLSRVLAAQMA